MQSISCYTDAQDWCIDHGYTELSPYAGVSGRAEERTAAAQEEDLEGSGEEYLYDEEYQEEY